jgi:Tfp pilus assembly protein PilZ
VGAKEEDGITAVADRRSGQDRRESGLLRVPFVRVCTIVFDGGGTESAFIVNINVLGAYVACSEMPEHGLGVSFRFRPPGTERELELRGHVAWLNPTQQHPVHSLPPGFGVRFTSVPDDARAHIEEIVHRYTARIQQR